MPLLRTSRDSGASNSSDRLFDRQKASNSFCPRSWSHPASLPSDLARIRRLPSATPPSPCNRRLTAGAHKESGTAQRPSRTCSRSRQQEIQAGVRQNPNLVVTGSNVTLSESRATTSTSTVSECSASSNAGKSVATGVSTPRVPQRRRPMRDYHRQQEQQTALSVRGPSPTSSLQRQRELFAEDDLDDFKHELQSGHQQGPPQSGKHREAGLLERLDLHLARVRIRPVERDHQRAAGEHSASSSSRLPGQATVRTSTSSAIVVPPIVSATMEDLEQKASRFAPRFFTPPILASQSPTQM